MAGYPTDVFDTSDRLIKVAMAGLSFLEPEAAYKLLLFLVGAAVPLLFWAAAAWWGMGQKLSLLVEFLGVCVWWTDGGLAAFRVGMFGFGLASLYALTLAALFSRYLRSPGTGWAIMLLAGSPLGLLIHPGILPIALLPAAVSYWFHFRRLPVRRHLFLGFAALAAVCLNLFWIIPHLMNLAFATPTHAHFQDPFSMLAIIYLNMIREFNAVMLILPVAAVCGWYSFLRRGHRELAGVLGFSFLFLGVLFVAGGQLPYLRDIQPSRYGLPFLFLLVFRGARCFADWVILAGNPAAPLIRRVSGGLVFVVLVFSLVYFIGLQVRSRPRPRLVGRPAEIPALQSWLMHHTDRRARVLLEDNGPYNSVFPNGFASSLIAYYTRRELIGGPHWQTHLIHHYADLSGFTFFGEAFPAWNRRSAAEVTDLFNIGWVGAASPLTRKFFAAAPELFRPVGEAGGFQFFEVARTPSFFLEGRGLLLADYNRIELKEVSSATGRIVLSYHWHPRFRVSPPAQVVRVMLGKDPVGFLGILPPRPEMVIEIDYW